MTIAQTAHPSPEAIKQRHTRGIMLHSREHGRIHRLEGDLWAVPSEETGGFYRCNIRDTDMSCSCLDFRYQCVNEAGEPVMACKHISAATIARAKSEPCSCFGGYVTLTVEEDGQEHDELVPCRRCRVEG